ncbi:MAG: glycoside hydrolase family 2 protein [Cyclobacteriaceae bacterium]
MKPILPFVFLLLLSLACTTSEEASQETAASDWQPADNPLFTRWSADLQPSNIHQEYPRPTMVRDEWLNLNGLWQYTITEGNAALPDTFDGEILVPFPLESALSGVKQMLQPTQTLWYQRNFTVPANWQGQQLLLHFGAVDWHAKVYVNGQMLAEHKGGYDPFTIDISQGLSDTEEQVLTVEVNDPTDEGRQPTGKQTLNPRGIWYTPTSGIWRTVWLEPVPVRHIPGIKLTPDIDEEVLMIEVLADQSVANYQLKASATDEGQQVAEVAGRVGEPLRLNIKDAKLWSPDDPHLYDLELALLDEQGEVVDQVKSYFGMRKIAVAQDADGYNRLFLNNKPLFQIGPLDQGFWPEGLYTAPSDEALRYDVQATKDMGFNMIRKHVKVEPERWYYWCDRLGLLVWQDMPSGDEHATGETGELQKEPEAARQFETELQEMIDDYYNHPSIVMWVVFNEGWGQYETARLASWAQDYDPSRLINPASGWLDMGPEVGDVQDIHRYPGPEMPALENVRVAVLGEFGGQALPLEEHLWVQNLEKAPTHFKTSKTSEDLMREYRNLYEKLYPLIDKGLAAAVYTQTTDVESEVNGLMTYDREVIKMNMDTLKMLHQRTYRKNTADMAGMP